MKLQLVLGLLLASVSVPAAIADSAPPPDLHKHLLADMALPDAKHDSPAARAKLSRMMEQRDKYQTAVETALKQAWNAPAGMKKEAGVSFDLRAKKLPENVVLSQSSGMPKADEKALAAVKGIKLTRPLPDGSKVAHVTVGFATKKNGVTTTMAYEE